MEEKYIKLFWDKVRKTDTCWLWIGARNKKGYGVAWDGSRTQKAHRISFMLNNGYMPKLCVLHRCDVSSCVNPDHLFLGTRADNNADMMRKGRHVTAGTHTEPNYQFGTGHHGAILDDDSVFGIRLDKASGMSYSEISRKYNIGVTTAHKVVKRITWKHVK